MTAEAILAAEAERRNLMLEGDFVALADLLDPALSYVHMNGRRDDKAAYLAHVAHDFWMVDIRWMDARVRLYGRIAVLDGTITNSLIPASDPDVPPRDFTGAGLLVWSLEDRWRLLAYQGTRTT